MQKNIQKRLILLLVTTAFVLTIMGAASAHEDTSLSLTVSSSTVNVGDPVTFTSRLTRTSNGAGLNGQTVHFFVDNVEVGSSTTQTVSSVNGIATYTYTPSTAGTKNVQARFNRRNNPDYEASNSPTQTLTVNSPAVPDLSITKTPNRNPANYNAGENVVYTIVVRNTGTGAATNVAVTDTLPAGLTFVSASNGGSNSGGVITWNNINIAASGQQTLTLTASVNAGRQGQTLTNTVSTGCPQDTGPHTATSSIHVNNAVLTVDKYPDRNPSNYNVGENVVYTVYVRNNGPDAATGVILTDTIPAGLTFVSATNGGTESGGVVTWNIGNLAVNGEFTALVTALVNAGTQGQTLTNTVSAVNTQNPTPVTDTSNLHVNNAVLTVDKYPDRNPSNYNVGEDVVYTITVRNNGPDAATGVVLTDTIPAGLTFVSATNGGTESGGVVTWNIGNLAVNGEFTALLTARVNAGTQGQTLTNTVSAVNTQNPTPVTDTSDIYVNSAPLSITKTADKAQYNVGETVTYTINVTNNAVANGVPGDATGVVVTDTLPAGLTFVSATNGGVWDANTRTITWNVGNLAAGASFTPTVTATVTSDAAGKNLENTATADNDQIDDPVTATASIYVPSADLVLTKTVDKTNPTVKDTVVFTLIVNNNGPDTAVDVTVNDKLPAGVTYVSHVANFGTYDPNTGLWTISSLPNGASAVLTITAVVEQSGQIVNQANVTALTWDPNLDDNAASAAMTVQAEPEPEPKPVNAQTVGMQKTGAPIGALLVAFFMLVAGMVLPRRK